MRISPNKNSLSTFQIHCSAEEKGQTGIVGHLKYDFTKCALRVKMASSCDEPGES